MSVFVTSFKKNTLCCLVGCLCHGGPLSTVLIFNICILHTEFTYGLHVSLTTNSKYFRRNICAGNAVHFSRVWN
jgi:hypothetical protein